MADDIYVLDLLVTGASVVSVNDDGSGNDTIRVSGVYSQTIDIDLAWAVADGAPVNAGSSYFAEDDTSHELLIYGEIENAFGSNGCDAISGNDLGNILGGDQHQWGVGLSDTLSGAGGDDSLYGGSGDDELRGGADDDLLWGDAGNDAIAAGTGRDTVQGGAGADRLDGGGDAGDTLSYAASRRGVVVQLKDGSATLGSGGDAAGDLISGFTDVIGTALKDRIEFADKGVMLAGQGENKVYGGGSRDRVAVGGGNDHAYGGAGNDLIYGEIGDDTLSGDSGADRLWGGYGQDVLSGGSGADLFLFEKAATSTVDSPDAITDFSAAELDRIDLHTIDASVRLRGNQAFHLIDGDFTGVAGEVHADRQGSNLAISGDTNGDGQADFTIMLWDTTMIPDASLIL